MNVTEVVFSGFYKTQICGLYQYDYGQVLKFTDITLPSTYEVHFAQSGASTTVTVLGDSNGVQIPDQYLLADLDIRAYIYLHEEETDGETVYQVLIPVIARPEPTDVEPTPVEQDIITQTIAALNSAVDTAEGYAADASQSASDSAASAISAQAWAEAAQESAESIDTSSFATKASLEAETQARISAVNAVGNAVTSVGNDLRSETTRAQSEEARIEGLTNESVKYTSLQSLTDTQKGIARTNIDAVPSSALSSVADSLSASINNVGNRVTAETNRARQEEASIRSDIPTSAQISALAPVQSVNGQTGAVTLPTATTSASGLMSSTDKSRLDALYADYSSALTALGV